MIHAPARAGLLAAALLLAACGKDEPAPAPVAEDAASVEEAAAPPQADPVADDGGIAADPASNPDAPLLASDLDAYATGVKREIEVLTGHVEALKKARAAKDDMAEIAALTALGGVEVNNEGAAAAGLDPSRYASIKGRIDEVLSSIEMGVAMKPQIEAAEKADLSMFDEAQKQQHAEGLAQMKAAWAEPYAKLPPEIVDAFKAREAELAKLRADALALRLSVLQG